MCHWDQLGKELLIPVCCWRGNPVLMGAFPWIYSRGQVCYANPAGAGWSNKRIPGPVVPGCSSIPGFLTLQGGTTWERLGKSSQSPAGIFVLPGNRRGEGSERGWGHGRPVLVLCQRLWGHKSPDLVFPFQFLLARLGAAPGPPELPPRALSSAGQTPACPGSFFQLFLFKERGGKKRFPSFFLGWATSVLAWSSLSPPARAQPGLGTEGKTAPPPSRTLGLGLGRDFSTFPKAGFSSQFSLSEETELSLCVPVFSCCQGGIWGLGTLLAPVLPRLHSQLRSEPRFIIPVFFLCPALPGASCGCLLSGAAYACLYLHISLVCDYVDVRTWHRNTVLCLNQGNGKVLPQEAELEMRE